MLFKSKRCLIRRLTSADFDGLFELHSNPNVMRYASGNVQSESECLQDLNEVQAQYSKKKPNLLVYAIKNEDSSFIGTCAIVFDQKGNLEIGYRFCERFWGKGYATEITKELINYCGNQYDIAEILAYCFVANHGSIRVLEKCGFRLVKEFKNKEYDGMLDRHYILEL